MEGGEVLVAIDTAAVEKGGDYAGIKFAKDGRVSRKHSRLFCCTWW